MGRYLLGQLGDQEQRQLEERLMTQDDSFEQLQVLEDELIDEYLKNTLSEEDREHFEKHFLSTPERREKLKFAEAFRSYVATAIKEEKHLEPSPWQKFLAALRTPAPVLRYGFPVLLVGTLAGGLRMASTIQRLHTEIAQVRTEHGSLQKREQQLQQEVAEQRRRNQELEQQMVSSQPLSQKPPSPLSALATIALRPGLVRDSGTTQKLAISSGTELVELKLELADHKYKTYRVVLQDSAGAEVFTFNKTKPKRMGSNLFIVLTVPADVLPSDDYSLKLSGETNPGEFDPLYSYSLRVLYR